MDNSKLLEALANGGPSFVLLALVLFWVFTKYIPSIQKMFEDTLNKILETNKENNALLAERMEKLEEAILKGRA